MKRKNLVICNFPRFSSEIWLPTLWCQAKTFYEKHGKRAQEWTWVPCVLDCYDAQHKGEIKQYLLENPPDVFAVSLYVWNSGTAHDIAAWVKQTWPRCVIVSGGPHQYFKHDHEWFKKYPYLDASHPGDCYGEQCFLDILDNYDDASQTVSWDQVTDIRYPWGKSRQVRASALTMERHNRKSYDFDWSAFELQKNELDYFVSWQQRRFPNSKLLAVMETTRGCPYGCTYCDWGGGISTTVIQRGLEFVKQDINALSNYDLEYFYIADANFGIFGQRDVDIIEHVAQTRQKKRKTYKLGYGGFAKTENRLDIIKQILEIDLKYELSLNKEIKISLQTLDAEVLENIDRKNIPLESQLKVFEPVAKKNRVPVYAEIIMGLPGMTLDKFYRELDVFAGHGLSLQWFEWILLPEAPAYDRKYIEKWQLQTVPKTNGWSFCEEHARHDIVVASKTYSSDDYLEMLMSGSLYNLFVQGGYLSKTMSWILTNRNVSMADVIRAIWKEWFSEHSTSREIRQEVRDTWQKILSDPSQPCFFNVNGTGVFGIYFFVAGIFVNYKGMRDNLSTWLFDRYQVPNGVYTKDVKNYITTDTAGTSRWYGLMRIDYGKRHDFFKNDVNSLVTMYRLFLDSGKIFSAKKRWLGFIPA